MTLMDVAWVLTGVGTFVIAAAGVGALVVKFIEWLEDMYSP